jgi:hypothetical protein
MYQILKQSYSKSPRLGFFADFVSPKFFVPGKILGDMFILPGQFFLAAGQVPKKLAPR